MHYCDHPYSWQPGALRVSRGKIPTVVGREPTRNPHGEKKTFPVVRCLSPKLSRPGHLGELLELKIFPAIIAQRSAFRFGRYH